MPLRKKRAPSFFSKADRERFCQSEADATAKLKQAGDIAFFRKGTSAADRKTIVALFRFEDGSIGKCDFTYRNQRKLFGKNVIAIDPSGAAQTQSPATDNLTEVVRQKILAQAAGTLPLADKTKNPHEARNSDYQPPGRGSGAFEPTPPGMQEPARQQAAGAVSPEIDNLYTPVSAQAVGPEVDNLYTPASVQRGAATPKPTAAVKQEPVREKPTQRKPPGNNYNFKAQFDRTAAENLLTGDQPGTYLTRPSSKDPQSIVLSYKDDKDVIRHCEFKPGEKGQYVTTAQGKERGTTLDESIEMVRNIHAKHLSMYSSLPVDPDKAKGARGFDPLIPPPTNRGPGRSS